MSLRFQRLLLILVSVIMIFVAVLLILYNGRKNISYFYTPSELASLKIDIDKKVRLGGFVEKNPAIKLSENQSYFFTHGDSDTRVLTRHFYYFKEYTSQKNINANYWLIKESDHLDGMLKYPDEYAMRMELFFNSNLE